jgi:1,4-alpha-glucan branching enzyme
MVSKTYYKTRDYCKVTFNIASGHVDAVDILGLNNNWSSPIPMQRGKDGNFIASIHLPKSSIHEFKYLINKENWINDPSADGEVPNPFGTTNSVLSV